MTVDQLPDLNAALNATTALLLLVGYRFIRRRQVTAHRTCMLLAVAASVVFLTSYIIYHARVGSVPYRGIGWMRTVYFTILISHTVLATAIVPLVAVTLIRALRGRIE